MKVAFGVDLNGDWELTGRHIRVSRVLATTPGGGARRVRALRGQAAAVPRGPQDVWAVALGGSGCQAPAGRERVKWKAY